MHRESLWRILRAYEIPQQIIDIIKSFYNNFTCRVSNSETSFEVKTGVRRGCTMSAMLFNMTIYCVMRRTTDDQSWGIRWTLLSTLEDVDFGDDLALVSHTHQHIQEKTTRLSTYAQRVGLKISQKKAEVMLLKVSNPKRATYPSCQSSKQRTSGESCKSFGLTPSPTNSYSPTAIKTAWRPSSWEGEERAGRHHSHSPSLDT